MNGKMVKKYLCIVCLIFLNNNGFSNGVEKDSGRIHFFEIGYFASPTLRNGIYKTDQHGVPLKFSFNLFQYKKWHFSINPNFTFLTNKMYRGNFIERPAEISFTEIILRANSFGVSLAPEYKVNKRIKVRTEFGLSKTSNSFFSRRDKIKDNVTCSSNDSGEYYSLCDFVETKKGFFASLSCIYLFNERISLSVGYLYRKSNYVLQNYTYYNACGFVQETRGNMSPRNGSILIALQYNFSLSKFK